MTYPDHIHTQSPITRYLIIGGAVVLFLALVKFLMGEPPLETREVTINNVTYSYQVSGDEKHTLTHMIETYKGMARANNMNKQCVYLTPRDTQDLDENTKFFEQVVTQLVDEDVLGAQHLSDVQDYTKTAETFTCNATGRAAVEHFTYASRDIREGFYTVR